MKPSKIYAELLEEDALQQFNDAMAQDFVVQGALMPDAHKGYSLPIGGVVACKDVVVPAYVGMDIGCTDRDTEYLTKNGWVSISDYNGEEIMTYDAETDTCHFAYPQRYIVNECEYFNHLKNTVVDQMLTDDHKVIMFSSRNTKTIRVASAAELINKNKSSSKGINQLFKTTIPLGDCSGVELSDDEIRLMVAIQADGCIRSSGKVEFHLKKPRKIERLKSLLAKLEIVPNIYNIKDDTWGCSLHFAHATKDLSPLWTANLQQLKVVIDEVGFWDGFIKTDGRINYSSKEKANVDLIQYAFAACGIRANFNTVCYSNRKGAEKWNDTHMLYSTNNEFVCFPKQEEIQVVASPDGKSYCFTTETGYWVMRRSGKICITGNCGMCAIKTDIHLDELDRRDLIELFKLAHEQIPTGKVGHKKIQTYRGGECTETAKTIMRKRKALNQIGTLGGGNHFIEVGVGRDGLIWITIHSGSRGLGHGLASYYMAKAANADEPVEGHFPLHVDSELGKDYIKDLAFALDYALENRMRMVRKVFSILSDLVNREVRELEFINRHHNHAELKDGLWIHRKGATHAEEGMMGVIPGNMRDGVFIVRGKGCAESMSSSSHGAGRIMGRYRAKKVLKAGAFKDTMGDIICAATKGTLDEAPGAYKNIFEVMDQQSDMVDIVDYVRPLVSIKETPESELRRVLEELFESIK